MLAAEGRAAGSSLFIFTAALLLLAAAALAGEAYRWGAIALLVAACAPWRALPRSATTVTLALFCGWLLVNAALITPAYSAESLYRPVVLFAAFAAFASLGAEASARLYRAGLGLMAALVLLGLVQHFFGFWHIEQNGLRASAIFRTPNTFASAINLILLPLVAVYLTRDRSAKVLAVALWLFAGLVATQSRGGMLAMFAGLAFLALCLGRDGLRGAAQPVLRLLAGGAAVWVAMLLLGKLAAPMFYGAEIEAPSLDAWLGRNFSDRREIYALTLQLILERPWLGGGANMFWPLFEPHVPDRFGEQASFLFAHSDYLQVWLEYGLPGLLLLLGVVVFALRAAHASRLAPGSPIPLACGAALATCFVHAVVDFPLYVPFVLFLVGAALGALVRSAPQERVALSDGRADSPYSIAVPVRGAIALVALALLAQPTLAEIATDRAVRVMKRGDVDGGLYWQSVARRLEPRNLMHYWAESVTWRELGRAFGDRRYWTNADRLLEEGIRANPPFAFNITLDRARLHRMHGDKLEHAASREEILGWVQATVAKAPRSRRGQAELASALAFAGRKEDAVRIENALRVQKPDTAFVRTLGGAAK